MLNLDLNNIGYFALLDNTMTTKLIILIFFLVGLIYVASRAVYCAHNDDEPHKVSLYFLISIMYAIMSGFFTAVLMFEITYTNI